MTDIMLRLFLPSLIVLAIAFIFWLITGHNDKNVNPLGLKEKFKILEEKYFECCTENALKLVRIDFLENKLSKIKQEIKTELNEIDDNKPISHENLRGTCYQILQIIKEAKNEE